MAQDAPTDKQPTQFLATIVSQFIEQGMQDEELETPPLLTPITNHPLIRLDELFDIYGLLDADLPGEGGNVEVDETIDDILTPGA